jgi:hypothetical protein
VAPQRRGAARHDSSWIGNLGWGLWMEELKK